MDNTLSRGELLAQRVTNAIGSWRFILAQGIVLTLWWTFNSASWFPWHPDSYPFILSNLAMSAEAAFTGPILLIAAVVAARRDHLQADRDTAILERLVTLVDKIEQLEERELAQLVI